MVHFLARLTSLIWIHFKDGKLLVTDLGDWNDTFIPVTGGTVSPCLQERSAGSHCQPSVIDSEG
jgi:hypothetical protein